MIRRIDDDILFFAYYRYVYNRIFFLNKFLFVVTKIDVKIWIAVVRATNQNLYFIF